MPSFIQNGQKTQKLTIFAISRFWLVGLVGQKMIVGFSNPFYVVFGPLLTPMPNIVQIGRKTQKFKIVAIGRGQGCRSKNGRTHFKHSVSVTRLTNDLFTKFESS